MSEHTPGPYQLHAGRNPHYGDDKREGVDYEATMQRCFYVAGPDKRQGDSHFIADVIVSRTPEGEANAVLFAAAPDLLAACKAAIVTYEHAVCDNCGIYGEGCGDCHHTEQFKAMRAAIAKADLPKGKP